MIKSFFILIITCAFCYQTQAQKFLLLSQRGAKKRVKINQGDVLRFKFKGDDRFYQDKIVNLAEGLIFLETTIINVKDVGVIDIRDHKDRSFNLPQYAAALPVAGVGYFLIDQVNNSIVDGNKLRIDEKVARTSGILIGLGFLIKWTERKYFKVNDRNRIQVIDFTQR
ncbi:hypothetical protein QQ008_16545 [Fulvivirgaceae bacterium BMA10]|uniref:Uncharacterized protein n=1 Tax=Splendidivirga corallicola TaxID=3051826 RepID=A0ABT8KQH1_9BACT|nr:hypothetical protein [Fulvivirgaceae bacterium BMA10]